MECSMSCKQSIHAHLYTNTPNRRRVFCCLDRGNLVQKVRIQVKRNLYLLKLFTPKTDFFFCLECYIKLIFP